MMLHPQTPSIDDVYEGLCNVLGKWGDIYVIDIDRRTLRRQILRISNLYISITPHTLVRINEDGKIVNLSEEDIRWEVWAIADASSSPMFRSMMRIAAIFGDIFRVSLLGDLSAG